jgi:hypothetical protein
MSTGPAMPADTAATPPTGAPGVADEPEVTEQPLYAGRLDPFRGKSLAQKVQELADREEIRELIATYAHRVAHGQPIAGLFTGDGVFINARPGQATSESRGRAELEARFGSRGHETGGPLPMIHNQIIQLDSDEGRGICSNELRITENGRSIIASAWYEDRFCRENGRWLFAERKVTFFHWVSIQEGWTAPAAK